MFELALTLFLQIFKVFVKDKNTYEKYRQKIKREAANYNDEVKTLGQLTWDAKAGNERLKEKLRDPNLKSNIELEWMRRKNDQRSDLQD